MDHHLRQLIYRYPDVDEEGRSKVVQFIKDSRPGTLVRALADNELGPALLLAREREPRLAYQHRLPSAALPQIAILVGLVVYLCFGVGR